MKDWKKEFDNIDTIGWYCPDCNDAVRYPTKSYKCPNCKSEMREAYKLEDDFIETLLAEEYKRGYETCRRRSKKACKYKVIEERKRVVEEIIEYAQLYPEETTPHWVKDLREEFLPEKGEEE